MTSAWTGSPFLALVTASAVAAGFLLVLGYVERLRGLVSRHFVTVPQPPADWPRVDVIVPPYNERRLVEAKIRNLLALQYPQARLRFWIVDGGSDDGTQERVEEAARHDGRIQLIRFASRNKVWQLSSALKWGQGEWVLVRDAVEGFKRERSTGDLLRHRFGQLIIPPPRKAPTPVRWQRRRGSVLQRVAART